MWGAGGYWSSCAAGAGGARHERLLHAAGEFAAVNKFARAEMAVRNGADLVLEPPTPGQCPEPSDLPGAAWSRCKKPGW
ncbi:MAG: nucleotidyltransferase family protein [Vescimonas sp.]